MSSKRVVDPAHLCELRHYVSILADWSAPYAAAWTIYVFGSRVRGDHRPDSDLDVMPVPTDVFDPKATEWFEEWQRSNASDLRALLDVKLDLVDFLDKVTLSAIEAASHNPVLVERNVIVVATPSAPRTSST